MTVLSVVSLGGHGDDVTGDQSIINDEDALIIHTSLFVSSVTQREGY